MRRAMSGATSLIFMFAIMAKAPIVVIRPQGGEENQPRCLRERRRISFSRTAGFKPGRWINRWTIASLKLVVRRSTVLKVARGWVASRSFNSSFFAHRGSVASEALGRTHAIRLTAGGGPEYGPATLPSRQYLVLGDNRGNSRDGRSFGLVPTEAILGQAIAVIYRDGGFTWREL